MQQPMKLKIIAFRCWSLDLVNGQGSQQISHGFCSSEIMVQLQLFFSRCLLCSCHAGIETRLQWSAC